MRNEYHYSPKNGWINDPNGLVYVDGEYHIFYQYYPNDIIWGPMHWGHAKSKNCVDWEELDVALCPDELGYIFSGSAVIDKENISGFGTKEKPAMILMYTSHMEENHAEQQSIAYSTDYVHFTKYEGNPVIKNESGSADFKPDFRDPKIVENTILGGYTAVFATGKVIEFYHTNDFKNWEKTGEFSPAVCGGFDDLLECPDLMCFDTEDGKKWVLHMSVNIDIDTSNPGYEEGPRKFFMQYFVGEFDGKTFTSKEQIKDKNVHLSDFGWDNYAMVSFAGTKDCIMLGWAENWDYVNDIPAKENRGTMTVPRKVELVKTCDGYRLAFSPFVTENEKMKSKLFTIKNGEKVSIMDNNEIVLSYNEGEMTLVRDNNLLTDKKGRLDEKRYREISVAIDSLDADAKDCINATVLYDKNVLEIFTGNGLNVFTVRI